MRAIVLGKKIESNILKLLAADGKISLECTTTTVEALRAFHAKSDSPSLVVCKLGSGDDDTCYPLIEAVRNKSQDTFVMVLSYTACNQADTRQQVFGMGVNMVTSEACYHDVQKAIQIIVDQDECNGKYMCPHCGLEKLSEVMLARHCSLYHSNDANIPGMCPICQTEYSCIKAHLHYAHEGMEFPKESRHIYQFALAIVRRKSDGKFLLVQEISNQGYWLPAGRVDVGESFVQGAMRESQEEAGVDIKITGILSIEAHPHKADFVRQRIVFLAEPVDERQHPKTLPDYESVGATWVSVEDLSKLKMRGSEPAIWFPYVAMNKPVYPLTLLDERGRG